MFHLVILPSIWKHFEKSFQVFGSKCSQFCSFSDWKDDAILVSLGFLKIFLCIRVVLKLNNSLDVQESCQQLHSCVLAGSL